MAALVQDTDYFVHEVGPNSEIVQFMVCTKNTVDATDTIDVVLTKWGISAAGFIGAYGWKHTTDNSVSAREFATTAVSAGTLTLTVPGGTSNDPRFYLVIGTSGRNPA
jgi:hypothetical protein